jgi:nitrite reductase/ring-hydroxylating ferredoxin subunit
MIDTFSKGWYYFAISAQIKKGKIYTFNYFGTSFVCYRDSHNSVNVFDAYCPHLGAHLGVGGRIVNDLLVCPFHGWKYNSNGRCVEIPYCNKIPKRAYLHTYQVQEVNSRVFFYLENISSNVKISANALSNSFFALKKMSLKNFFTIKMQSSELQKIIEKAKTLYDFKIYEAGFFMVQSKLNPISLFVTTTPINNYEHLVSFSASIEKNFINFFRSFFIRQKAKKLFNTMIAI